MNLKGPDIIDIREGILQEIQDIRENEMPKIGENYSDENIEDYEVLSNSNDKEEMLGNVQSNSRSYFFGIISVVITVVVIMYITITIIRNT